MIDYAAARQLLADTLEPVWPGRVYPYRPTRPNPVAGVYICTHDGGWGDVSTWDITFTVRVVADGADRPADAMLDDLCTQVCRVVGAAENVYRGASVWEPVAVDDVTELPAYTFTLTVGGDPAGWCADPPATAVTVPPVPIGA